MALLLKKRANLTESTSNASKNPSKASSLKGGKTKLAKKVAEKPKPPPVLLSEIGLQNFKIERVHRDQLKSAPYNPRVITEGAKARLKLGLKRHGSVEPVVWNKRTGNIVGGHQRITALDSLAGTSNYLLDVSVIDVDESREKELNVLLNNPDAQGDWDLDKLADIFKDKTLEVSGTGFDVADIYRLFGDSPLLEHDANLDEYAQRIGKAREGFEAAKQMVFERDSQWFYLVVIFQSIYDMDDFLDKAGLPGGRWQSGADLRRLLSFEAYEPPVNVKKPNLARTRKKLELPNPA